MSNPCPERPNDAGESPVIIRWIVETESGWIGAWDKAPLEKHCLLEQQLAEARALICAYSKAQGIGGLYAAEQEHAAALKAAREQP